MLFFHFFRILIFKVVSGVKGQKTGPKRQKIMSVTLHIDMIMILGTLV